MDSKAIIKTLEPWLAQVRRPAWKPVVEDGDRPEPISKFGGRPWIGEDAPWPACGICEKPLPLFLQLDLSALPEELGQTHGTGLLQLFYCTRDNCQGMGGWEPFVDDLSRVRLVQVHGSDQASSEVECDVSIPGKRIVGWERFLDLPSPAEHELVGLKYGYDFKKNTLRIQCPELQFDHTNPMQECPAEEIANADFGDKLAGWPAWVQGVEYPLCPRCRKPMVLLFQVDSNDNVPFMFGDVGCAHITQCLEHKEVVAFAWACG